MPAQNRTAPFGYLNRLAIVVFGIACFVHPRDTSAQFTAFEQVITDFNAEVARGVAEDAGGCVMVCVFVGPDQVWSAAHGWADIENRVAATPETIGRVGSISKSFTAVAMVQLVDRDLVELDGPVAEHLPSIRELADPPEESPAITFRMLASHTAGLIREPLLSGAATGSIYKWEEKVLASIPKTHYRSTPGTEYAYSNIGFGILGLAASRAAGQPFMQLVDDQIFTPLDMTSSTFVVNEPDKLKRLAVGYHRDRSGGISASSATREHLGRGYKVPNGGIYSTVGDLAKFSAAMMDVGPARIVSPTGLRQIFMAQQPASNYGLGFSISEGDGLKVVGHGGSVAGYNADLRFDLSTQVGVAMLRTTSYSPPTSKLLVDLVSSVTEQ